MIFKLLAKLKPIKKSDGLQGIKIKPLSKVHLQGEHVGRFIKQKKLKNDKL
tara:strand:+ start:203 stop:355 length:153 start_codon:yes stop_codon:yes gene_type:complete